MLLATSISGSWVLSGEKWGEWGRVRRGCGAVSSGDVERQVRSGMRT